METIIRAEVWVEYHDVLDTVSEVESENIIASSRAEVIEKYNQFVEKFENDFIVDDSGYEIIDMEVRV